MKKGILVASLLLLPPLVLAGGAVLRRAEGSASNASAPNKGPQADCKSVTTTGREFFEVAVSTKFYADRKLVEFRVLDSYTTNYVEVSSFSTTSNDLGMPVTSLTPLQLPAGPGLRFFVRRPSGQTAVPGGVCGLQIE